MENNSQPTTPNTNPPPAQPLSGVNNSSMSNESKTIITILLLVFVYPLGIIFMWMWMKWPKWLKVILTLLIFLPLILGVLLAMTLIAINPARQFSEANNTKRTSDVTAILNSVGQYAAANNNVLPTGIPTDSAMNISTTGANLCSALVPNYIAALPVDPKVNEGTPIADCSAPYDTGYTIFIGEDGRVAVSAPQAELDASITISR